MEKPSDTRDIAGSFLPLDQAIEESSSLSEREGLPALSLSDKKAWWFFNNGDNAEHVATVGLAELWARTMQARIANGEALSAIWLDAFVSASDEFTTERMLVKAVTILSRSWQFGAELRLLFDEYRTAKGALGDDTSF